MQMPTVFDLTVSDEGPSTEMYNEIDEVSENDLQGSRVFLRVLARPDFVTHLPEVLYTIPRVRFELVLDPLLFGFMPLSTLGTVILILFTTILGVKVIYPIVIMSLEDVIRSKSHKVVRIKSP